MSRPDPLVRRDELVRDHPWDTGVEAQRRFINLTWILAAAALCIAMGLCLVFFPPVFLFGALGAIGAVLAILSRPYLGLLIYCLVLIVRPAELSPGLAVLRLERVVGVVTLAAMYLEMYRAEGRIFVDRSRQSILLLALLPAVVATIPLSYWPTRSGETIFELVKIMAFYVMIVHLVTTPRRLRGLMVTYIGCIVYLGITSLKGYYSGEVLFAQGIERAVGTTSAGGDPNSLGATMGTAVPIILLLFGQTRRTLFKLIMVAAVGVLVWTMILTGSRSSLLGFIAAMVVLWWLSPRRVVMGIFGVMLAAILFYNIPDSYKQRYSTMTQSDLDESSHARLRTWKSGLLMVLDRPFTGVGVGCFGVAHAEGYSGARRNWLQAHSLYVQVPAELGLIGATIFFAFLITAVRLNRRTRAMVLARGPDWTAQRLLLDGILASFAFLFVYSAFGHTMLRSTWYVLAAVNLTVLRMQLDPATFGNGETPETERETLPAREDPEGSAIREDR